MDYGWNTRKAFCDGKIAAWEKETAHLVKKLNKEEKEIYEAIFKYGKSDTIISTALKNLYKRVYRGESLKEFADTYLSKIIEIYVKKEHREDFESLLEEIPTYTYTVGWNRRSLRTATPVVHLDHLVRLLYAYMVLGCYGVSAEDYLCDRLDEELLDFKKQDEYANHALHFRCRDDIYAARINANDASFIESVKEAFLSENNTVIVTTDLIRGVVKSKNTELHVLLAKFLLAAKLQEGVRQAIMENADCGKKEAFFTLMNVVEDNDLLRFSSVKRAVATYTGLFDADSVDRLTDKIFRLIKDSVTDLDYAKQLLSSEDSVELYIGLWAHAFHEVDDALDEMKKLIDHSSRHQLITVSYFNNMIQRSDVTNQVAQEVFEKYPEDIEMMAAYISTYIPDAENRIHYFYHDNRINYEIDENTTTEYLKQDITEFFANEEVARRQYEILKHAAALVKKEQVFAPCIFPWYGVKLLKSDFLVRMVIIAYILEDQDKIDECCGFIPEIDATTYARTSAVKILLHDPKTDIQKKALINAIADKETETRKNAFYMLLKMDLSEDEYRIIETFLKAKNQEIRQYALRMLARQSEEKRLESAERLLGEKDLQKRLAGYEVLRTLMKEDPNRNAICASVVKKVISDEESLSEQEKIQYQEIVKEKKEEDSVTKENGYGLYDPSAEVIVPKQYHLTSSNCKKVRKYFNMKKKEIDKIINRFVELIERNHEKEYRTVSGEIKTLGGGLTNTSYVPTKQLHEKYPFPELWEGFYDEYIKDEKTFWNLILASIGDDFAGNLRKPDVYTATLKDLFGEVGIYEIPELKYLRKIGTIERNDFNTVLRIIASIKGFELPFDLAIEVVSYMIHLSEEKKWHEVVTRYDWQPKDPKRIVASDKYRLFINRLVRYKKGEEFVPVFYALYQMDDAYRFNDEDDQSNSYNRYRKRNELSLSMYIRAASCGEISEDVMVKYGMETVGVEDMCRVLQSFDHTKEEDPFDKLGEKTYKRFVNKLLDVELTRGEAETPFSLAVGPLKKVYGMDRLFALLNAMGKDPFDRSTYYFWREVRGRKESLSHLINICYPNETDTQEVFEALVKKNKISEDRLVEVAMYAPQWIGFVEKYLKYEGMTSASYYFMAHMNESFGDEKMAVIARYTPLSKEELNDGCFDVAWFKEAYETIGEKRFAKLYKAAKYISDGAKHTRARKYADACLGKVSVEEVEKEITAKRNKDHLMSYGLIPLKDQKDQLHRYEFLQKFLKESKKFGAQRRASEAKCVEVALKNMATSLGYADDLRLTLAMETALIEENREYFEKKDVNEFTLQVVVNDEGKAELVIEKAGKVLKSVPAALKKNEDLLERKEFVTKLRNQYARAVKMFENSMEERTLYTVSELRVLFANPVIHSILDRLVFIMDGKIDLLSAFLKEDDEKEVRIAHCYDLYCSGEWSKWQQYWFDRQLETNEKQPFKQIWRELYVKLDEEMDAKMSRMFAGHQVQPKKTVATLKSRKWVADYEGLQKIYYKDNIVATIYALADWFSPADAEEPTIEYVAFYGRSQNDELKIRDIPDIVYSEVMRDVDLAVSVAHAGGVDPVTSHSTIEMRKVIVEFNMKLFKLNNVRLEGTHAYIRGKYGEYSVQLGSGIIHKTGSHMINILPVHSQSRGKIFLPFVDDDPKTAEIMSKIILLAEDQKIKDPYILEQITK